MPWSLRRPPANRRLVQDRYHQQGAGTTQHRRRLSPGNPAGRQWVIYRKRLHLLLARPVPGRAAALRRRFCREELTDCHHTETPSGGSLRILALRMKTSAGFVNIISAYAPTLTSNPEAKDKFYEVLQEKLSGIPSSEAIY